MKEYTIDQLFAMKWVDLNPKQHIAIVSLSDQIQKYERGSKEQGLIKIEILKTLRKNRSAVAQLNIEQALDCVNDISFFRRDKKGKFITPWLYFPGGNFKVSGVRFSRPENNGYLPLGDRNFDQLIYADSAFTQFCQLNYRYQKETGELAKKQLERDLDEALNSMIAVLYCKPEDFDIAQVEVHARLIPLKLTTPERTLILHTYSNVRAYIMDRCFNLFPKPPETDGDELNDQEPIHTGPMWMNLRYDLAETEVFKGFDTARSAMVYDALDYLDKKALEANEARTKNQNGNS